MHSQYHETSNFPYSPMISLCPYTICTLKWERKFMPKRKSFPNQISIGPFVYSLVCEIRIDSAMITDTGIAPLAVVTNSLISALSGSRAGSIPYACAVSFGITHFAAPVSRRNSKRSEILRPALFLIEISIGTTK